MILIVGIFIVTNKLDKELEHCFHLGSLLGEAVPALLHKLFELWRAIRRDLRTTAFQDVQRHSHEVAARIRLLPRQHLFTHTFCIRIVSMPACVCVSVREGERAERCMMFFISHGIVTVGERAERD